MRVSARTDGENDISLSVSDTGIGIAPEDHESDLPGFRTAGSSHPAKSERHRARAPAFEEARHISGWLGRSCKPARPRVYLHAESPSALSGSFPPPNCCRTGGAGRRIPTGRLVLFIEDNPETIITYRSYLRDSGFQVISAATTREAEKALETF